MDSINSLSLVLFFYDYTFFEPIIIIALKSYSANQKQRPVYITSWYAFFQYLHCSENNGPTYTKFVEIFDAKNGICKIIWRGQQSQCSARTVR